MRASSAPPSVRRSSSASTSAVACRETSIAAVSTMSWLVAPRCTYSAASAPTAVRSSRTSGSAGSRLRGRRLRCAPRRSDRHSRFTDPRGGVRRNEADCDARLRKGVLRIEHSLQPRSIRDCVLQFLWHEDRWNGITPRRTSSGRRPGRRRRSETRRPLRVRRGSPAPRARARGARDPRRSPPPRRGKYMRVATRLRRPRAKIPTRRCGACSRPSTHGTRPGFTVTNSKRPASSVPERPKPVNPSSSATSRLSAGCASQPAAFACQTSTIPSGTGAPAPSRSTPRMWIARGSDASTR